MIYQISSGQGPAECELGVAKFVEYLQKHYEIAVIDASEGYNEGTYRSVRIATNDNLKKYVGSVQWMCKSPYRPEHKRKNWFLDFSACEMAKVTEFDETQIRFEPIHSSGNGGQNVNKVESGIRATYVPTGDIVICTRERSQLHNKHDAIERLRRIIQQTNKHNIASATNERWKRHTRIIRGNAKTVFVGEGFIPLPLLNVVDAII